MAHKFPKKAILIQNTGEATTFDGDMHRTDQPGGPHATGNPLRNHPNQPRQNVNPRFEDPEPVTPQDRRAAAETRMEEAWDRHHPTPPRTRAGRAAKAIKRGSKESLTIGMWAGIIGASAVGAVVLFNIPESPKNNAPGVSLNFDHAPETVTPGEAPIVPNEKQSVAYFDKGETAPQDVYWYNGTFEDANTHQVTRNPIVTKNKQTGQLETANYERTADSRITVGLSQQPTGIWRDSKGVVDPSHFTPEEAFVVPKLVKTSHPDGAVSPELYLFDVTKQPGDIVVGTTPVEGLLQQPIPPTPGS